MWCHLSCPRVSKEQRRSGEESKVVSNSTTCRKSVYVVSEYSEQNMNICPAYPKLNTYIQLFKMRHISLSIICFLNGKQKDAEIFDFF